MVSQTSRKIFILGHVQMDSQSLISGMELWPGEGHMTVRSLWPFFKLALQMANCFEVNGWQIVS